jgi:hypothetical protein
MLLDKFFNLIMAIAAKSLMKVLLPNKTILLILLKPLFQLNNMRTQKRFIFAYPKL